MTDKTLTQGGFVVIGQTPGHTVIAKESPLKRLNYFDGKFLRAPDLQLEQQGLLNQIRMSNQAGGSGVVHGYNVGLKSGDRLAIGAGFAIDPQGRVLYLPEEITVSIGELIEKSRLHGKTPARETGFAEFPQDFAKCELRPDEKSPGTELSGQDLYLITVRFVQAYCGQEDVYGKLCEEACISSTERPYIIDGVSIRATPLTLSALLATSTTIPLSAAHLRSRVASAYFAQERLNPPSLISGEGLRSGIWCLGAEAGGAACVPIAVLGRSGSNTPFPDAWIARRERMETPPRRYWAGRMAMRPWNIFLAQVLQFQCQLAQCFKKAIEQPPGFDPCEAERVVVAEAAKVIGRLKQHYEVVSANLAEAVELRTLPVGRRVSVSELAALEKKLAAIKTTPITNRYLINCGIIELPSAGYLPVKPDDTMTVNEQVRRMMGEGVDLRFCVVRPDYVPHALEEVQHMDRISLLEGLDDPAAKPAVDVLVPDGEILTREVQAESLAFRGSMDVVVRGQSTNATHVTAPAVFQLRGSGHAEVLETGGGAFYFAGAGDLRQKAVTHGENINRVEATAAADIGGRIRSTFARGGERIERAAAEAAAVIQPITSIAAVSVFVPDFVIAVWTEMRCERNPFSMNPGANTPTSLRVVVAASSGRFTLFREIQIQGNFHLESISGSTRSGNGQVLTGRLLGVAKDRSQDPGKPVMEHVEGFDMHATVRLRQGNSSFQFELDLKNTSGENSTPFHPVVNWGGEPMEVVLREGSGEAFITRAQLNKDHRVLAPDDSDHTLALTGVEVIGTALHDAGFAQRAGEQLFPEKTAPRREVQVGATRDWVLFHRRRSKTCEADFETPLPVAERRYLVWHLKVEEKQLEIVVEALRSNKPESLAPFPFDQVSLVEYAATTPVLRSSPEAVQSDWKAANPGDQLIYGAIARQGAAQRDGEILTWGRLERLREVVQEITPPDEKAIFESLLQLPEPLRIGGTDGAMVLLTKAKLPTTCQAAFRIKNGSPEQIAKLIEAGKIDSVFDGSADIPVPSTLGDALFKNGTAEPVQNGLEAVIEAWKNQGGGLPSAALVTYQDQAGSNQEGLSIQQGQAILKNLNADIQPLQVPSPEKLPTDCPSMILIEEPPQIG